MEKQETHPCHDAVHLCGRNIEHLIGSSELLPGCITAQSPRQPNIPLPQSPNCRHGNKANSHAQIRLSCWRDGSSEKVLLTQICKHIHQLPLIRPNPAWPAMTEPAANPTGHLTFSTFIFTQNELP